MSNKEKVFFTSDLHFNHANIIQYEPNSRGQFSSLEEMNEKLISNWNSVVGYKDTVYMLGDIFMGPISSIEEIMPRLNGKKILIRGNHDTNKRVAYMSEYLDGVYDLYNLKYEGRIYVLCHYPIREWMHKENGSVHLYGHVHSNEHRNGLLSDKNSYHVGTDTNQLTPISIDEINKKLFPCYHKGEINSLTCKLTGEIEYHVCADCEEIVEKNIINEREVWV